MTPSILLDNVLAWAAQVCVLTAVAGIAACLLKDPRARLSFWQGTLAVAVLLPLVQSWSQVAFTPGVEVTVSVNPVIVLTPVSRHWFWRSEYALAIIAAGAVLRLLWIAAGFVRLRRHRLAARALTEPPVPFERSHVRWYLSETVTGPVTFGCLRPSILLPARVNELPDDLREAIACHELVHVRRRDWLFVLAEELIRALLWFHPAIWFILSRVQLAREQAVDLEVVRLTRNRESYLDALVAVAAQRLEPDVAPAPLFLKRRQLASRVAAVLNFKEDRMSRSNIMARFATVSSAALLAARIAVWFFPLQAPAQIPPDSPGITVDAGGQLMHRGPVFYAGTVIGTVTLEAALNQKGEVSDVRVLSGPEELRKPALQSVLQWHYSTDSGVSSNVRVTIKFEGFPDQRLVGGAPGIRAVLSPFPPQASPTITKIEFPGVPAEVAQKLRARLPVREGDALTPLTLGRVTDAAREVDEHFSVSMATNAAQTETTLVLSLGFAPTPPVAVTDPGPRIVKGVGITALPPAGDPMIIAPQVTGDQIERGIQVTTTPMRIRVGANVQAANLISRIAPEYPPLARQSRIQGMVRFTIVIGRDGTVQNLQLVSGHPLLVAAATDAVKQWVYKPTLLNGQPVEVITQVDVNFDLNGK